MARRRDLGPLRIEFCEGQGDWLPNFFGAVGRLNLGFGDKLGIHCGYGGGRYAYRVSPSVRRWAAAIAWESK